MRRIGVVIALIVISATITLSYNNVIDGIQEGSISVMNLFATDEQELTPVKVNESIMEFTRDDGVWADLPMRPFQWYPLGEWDLPYIDDHNENIKVDDIGGKTTIWITLSCPEQITMDLGGSFNINSNPAVDSVTLSEVSVGPEPKTFTIEFDTEGYSLEGAWRISMRWTMRGGSDDVVVHLGDDEGTGMTTFIEPLVVQSVDYLGGLGVFIDLYKPFESWESWDFHFIVSLDGSPFSETDHYYTLSGADEHYFISIEATDLTYGDHIFRWEADYGYSSHSSGSHEFTIEDEEDPEEPPVDDDDDPQNPPYPPNNDDEEPFIEPDYSNIDININICEYYIFIEHNFVSCEIQVEGTTSGCNQIVITANKWTDDIEKDISWRIDSYDTEYKFRYDGTGLEYHIKQFDDLSSKGDWSAFVFHVKYTVDLDYFEDLWSMEISPDNFPDVGDRMVIIVGAVEEPYDTESDMGLWSKNITAQKGSDPRETSTDEQTTNFDDGQNSNNNVKLIAIFISAIVVIGIVGVLIFLITTRKR